MTAMDSPSMQNRSLDWVGEISVHREVRRSGGPVSLIKQTGFPDLPLLEVLLHTGVRHRDVSGDSCKQFVYDANDYHRPRHPTLAQSLSR